MKKGLLSSDNKRDAIAYFTVASPFIFIVAVAIHFRDFIIHTVSAHVEINLGILMTCVYGVILIFMRMRHAQKDFRVIERFGKEAHAGRPMKELLEEPWLKKTYVRHYLSHIANTGGTLHSQMDQHAIESELHAFQAEYNSRLELPNFLVGFMIALGLLGTFIGLLQTLTGISDMLGGMGAPGVDVTEQFSKLVVELRKPLAGMGVAFSASMFGLVGSLVLAAMMTNLRRYIGRVVSLARNVMHDQLQINSHNPAVAPARAQNPASSTSSISNTTLAGKFELLAQKMDAVLTVIEESTNSTQRMVDMLGFGPRMRELSEKSLEEMKAFNTRSIDQQKLLQSIIDVNFEKVKSDRDLLELHQKSRDTADEMLQTIKGLAGSEIFFSQRRDQEFRDRLFTELKSLISTQTDHKKLAQSLIDVNDSGVKGLNSMAQYQRETREELSSLIGRLVEAIQKVEEVNIGGARHMYDIKDKLMKLSNSLNIVESIAGGIGGQTALLEALVEEARLANADNSNRPAIVESTDEEFY